jgi:aminoglycoside phosphotransferase (APT) family kinase protein
MIPTHVSTDEIARLLTERLGGVVSAVAPLAAPAAHRMLTARWQQADGTSSEIVIRFFDGPRAADEMRAEAAALRDLSKTGYPVPELYFSGLEDGMGGPYVVMERLGGQAMAALARRDPARWLEEAVTLVFRLHTLRWQNSFDWLQPALSPLDYAERQVRLWTGKAQQAGVPAALRGLAWLNTQKYRARACRQVGLVHRDLHPDNMLADGQKITGVVDWGELCIADPAVDVGWTHMVIATEGRPEWGDLFVGSYLRRNPDVAGTLPFWQVFAGCKRLVSMAMHDQTATERGLPLVEPEKREAVIAFIEAHLTDEDIE